MPEFSPLFLLILIFGASWLSKRIKQIKRMTEEQARRAAHQPLPPPTPFKEAAPVVMKQQSPVKKAPAQSQDPVRTEKPVSKIVQNADQEGRRLMEESSWNEQTVQKYQPEKPRTKQKTRSSFIPVFRGSALVQAVVTKEILTRPRSAWRPNRS